LLLAGAVAAAAWPLGTLLPLLGAPILALLLGAALATLMPGTFAQRLRGGLDATSRRALQLAIVVLGATIDLRQVAGVGQASLPVMLGSLATALVAAALVGRRLAVPPRLRTLIGVGTGICGASAIAAVTKVIRARESEVRYAISTIFAFNLAAVVVFPPVAHLFGMSQHAFGLWAGTAINDTSSVVAAAFAYGHPAGAYAVVVKLTRTTMIVPISLSLGTLAVRGRERTEPRARTLRSIFPWFLIAFLAASALDTIGALSAATRAPLSHAGLALTALALAAVGLSCDLSQIRRAGWRPVGLGALVWVTVALSSLALQALTGGVS
jgi:uncharacterized integral membrane protein (TIGR00698 family)